MPLLGLAFAAEFTDREPVVTDAAEVVGEAPWQVPSEGSAAADLARRVYALHRERMARTQRTETVRDTVRRTDVNVEKTDPG